MSIISAAYSFNSTGCITLRFIWRTNCGCVFRCRWFRCSSAHLVEFGNVYERGLVNGRNRLSGGIMLKGFFLILLCSIILIGKIHTQEVIVARERRPQVPTQTPQPSEQVTSESPTPAPRKSKTHAKKSAAATLTLEEM